MSSDESFESTEEGSFTFPCSAGDIKKGHYIVMKDTPAKVMNVSTSKTGKHGHAKCAITALCLFTNKKLEDSIPSSLNVDCPNVTKTEYSLINILEKDFISIMDEESGDVREDLKLSDHKHWKEMNIKLKNDFDSGAEIFVTILKAMGKEIVISHRKKS